MGTEEGSYFGVLQSKMFAGCLAVGVLSAGGRPRLGQGQLCEVPQDEVMSPALVSQQAQAVLQAGGRVAGKWPCGKGPSVLVVSAGCEPG